MRKHITATLAAVAVWMAGSIVAQEPQSQDVSGSSSNSSARFSWESVLRSETGKPVTGQVRLSFAIFRGGNGDPDSGTLVYGETVELSASEGRVTHTVGTGTPTFGALTPIDVASAMLSSDPEQALWLQVSVGDDLNVTLPRTRLAEAAWASVAGDSARLGGLPAEAYARIEDVVNAAGTRATGSGGPTSFVGGGSGNDAAAAYSTVAGGRVNFARAPYSSVLGGYNNLAWGAHASTIGGGESHYAEGRYSGIFSGLWNRTLGTASFVGGGFDNETSSVPDANSAVIAGGSQNRATAGNSFIGGGNSNTVSATGAVVGGGQTNTASGSYSTVPGGRDNTAAGAYSFAAGRRAKSNQDGAFTWADSQDADFNNNLSDSFHVRAKNGASFRVDYFFDAFAVHNSSGGDVVNGYASGSGRAGYFSSFSGTGDAIRAIASSGHGIDADSSSGNGVDAESDTGHGVEGRNTGGSSFKAGVRGFSSYTSGNGVIGEANGSGAYGVWGRSSSGWAGFFSGKARVTGDLHVDGTVFLPGGSGKVDHPLDPENKYLQHSFVESPDMKNVYDGVVVLGDEGSAPVELPSYFEAYNKDFRYQLTAVGASAPGLYVAQEIADNRFVVAGGAPGLKVCWQVTGIRKDAYAVANPVVTEQEKPAGERGTYLHPEAFGQDPAKGLAAKNEKK